MAITSIETFRHSEACLVRVTDSDGMQGWGQAAPYHADITEEFLHRAVTPWVLGKNADDIESIVARALDRNYKFMGTFLYRAVGGIDTALWDLKARRAGKSVCQLLGGTPGAFKVYGSSMRRDNSADHEVDRIVRAHAENGFEAFKIKVGPRLGNDDNPAGAEVRTRKLIPLIRKSLPANVKIFADANGSYDAPRAIEVGKWLADEGITFFEEPCPHNDVHATAQVTAALTGIITITGGEQDYVPAIWQLMLDTKAVHIAQPDVLYNGGVCRTLAVAKLAQASQMKVMPHTANRALQQVFTHHLILAIPNAAEYMEYSLEPAGWTDNLYSPAPLVRNGLVEFPAGPGWGVEIDQDWVHKASRRTSEIS